VLTHSSLQDRDHSVPATTHDEPAAGQDRERQSVIAPHWMCQTHSPPKITPCGNDTGCETRLLRIISDKALSRFGASLRPQDKQPAAASLLGRSVDLQSCIQLGCYGYRLTGGSCVARRSIPR
jgi:hypothetical protein